MNETSIGTAAIAQLAPMVDFVDMDGTLLQIEKFGEGVGFDFGKIIYNDLPGLGVNVDPF
jgi:L-alanine-DL-glutamate epimerase-like enolase superfamily enzyme